MKKGFTLAELLGVIAILGIIALIAVPVVNNSINESNEELYQTQLNQMIKGAKSYYAEHLDKLPPDNPGSDNNKPCSNNKACITLNELQEEGYLPLDAINPKTGENFSPNSTIQITNNNGKFTYKVLENTLESN